MRVLATAGHVDHGKSTLVRALTGMEPDRFAEERRRGMTIDLGYAWTALDSGELLAFVDVPGHQRFIANMLAGLGPVPAVMFVVAADEGWSRQSAEHLAAIDALQVRHGLLAVTRSDLADPGPVLADATARLAASSLGPVEAVAVSGATGSGVTELRAALQRLVARLPDPERAAPVRLWLDRSFSVRGAGTVVTGTAGSGTVTVGDTLELVGDGAARRVSVRGLQSAGADHDTVAAVARVAVNLRGVDAADVHRGDVLLTGGAWRLTRELDVRLAGIADGADLPEQLVLHAGTAAVPVRLRPLGDTSVRLLLDRALPLRAGDRAVLRDPGRQSVAAGVLVLDADPPPLRRRGAARSRAAELADAGTRPDPQAELKRRGHARVELFGQLGLDVTGLDAVDGWLVNTDQWTAWRDAAAHAVGEWVGAHPLEPGIPLAALRRAVGVPDSPAVLARVVGSAGLVVRDGRAGRPEQRPTLGAAEDAVRKLERRLADDPFAAPDREELASLRLGTRELAAAERVGRLVRVASDIVLLPEAVDRAVHLLAALPQPFTTSAARQALGTTRRVVIPLLEYLDGRGLTARVDASTRRVR